MSRAKYLNNMVTRTIQLHKPTWDLLKVVSEQRGTSPSQLVREILSRWKLRILQKPEVILQEITNEELFGTSDDIDRCGDDGIESVA